MSAREKGADISLLRLTDYQINYCEGCMSCAFKANPLPGPGNNCVIKDDVPFIFEQFQNCDGMIIGAPTYFLAPNAIIKAITDRGIALHRNLYSDREKPVIKKPAATIAVAGLTRWKGLMAPLLNSMVQVLGLELVGNMCAFAPGPGQTLLDPHNITRAKELGARVVTGEKETRPANVCPVCYSDSFIPLGDKRVKCPICHTTGTVGNVIEAETVNIEWDPACLEQHRWTPEMMKDHYIDWVLATKEPYKRDLKAINEARQVFQDQEWNWIKP